ncbi:MAG: hypothetical protein C0518_05530 [Opitutus sp.]|nr:hypothetical protein [Opitutus sp.]
MARTSKSPASKVSAQRARLFKLLFANPVSGLTPARLVSYLNAFSRGELRSAVLLWQQILERDDMIKPCDGKRRRAVASLKWEILPVDDSEQAKAHKEALEHFYNNLTAFDGLNEMERGGVRQLIKQMMTAVAMRYAVHEIIWQPGAPGGLTAQFKFLPLQFFENKTGKLRFLLEDHATDGVDLDEHFGEGNWMCNAGEGLMFAASIAYLFKTPTGLKAWVTFIEKFGVPGLHASTSAQKDSPEWDALVEAVSGFGEDLALVTNDGAKITPLEIKSAGGSPHASLVDRMDRALSRLWMGGDLATMAKGEGAVGSQPQSDDLDKLQEDDTAGISDALQEYVDVQVIRQRFGDVAPLAYFQLNPPARVDIDRERATDEFLMGAGVPVGKKQLMQRYGRAEPAAGDELATPPASPALSLSNGLPNPFAARAANERTRFEQTFRADALKELSEAQAKALRPLVDRLNAILALPDDKIDGALEALKRDLPRLNREVLKDAQTQLAFEKILSATLVSGATEARQKIQSATK